MADGGELVPWGGSVPVPLTEALTSQFYAWERRGRGWQVWPHPVELEPPFVPFLFHYLPPAPVVDDARKPTWIGSFFDSLLGRGGRTAAVSARDSRPADWLFEEPEPEPFEDASPIIELQLAVPPDLKVAPEAAEHLILSLSHCVSPVSFELLGTADGVTVQFACREEDWRQVREQVGAHFPDAVITEETGFLASCWASGGTQQAAVADFGLSHEFMRPLRRLRSFEPDPLISFAAALGNLADGETGVLQVLFERTCYPWAESMLRAAMDSEGEAFFADAPEMPKLARAKAARPLFAAAIRVAARSPRPGRAWEIARALGAGLGQLTDPMSNELIPLTNDDYPERHHEEDLVERRSRRSGMLLNSEELLSLVHLPSASVRVAKVKRATKKTKPAPAIAAGQALLLGENVHAGAAHPVGLDSEQRLQHLHMIGASGTGKSTLLLNLIVHDLRNGEGVAVLDPHGDLVDEVLGHVPEERERDVVLLDPADEEYPVGFNILSAHTALEQNLLASDLVAVFRRLSTSWGDQMTSVLGNAVLAFLESEDGGTLADLRRFLIEPEFRTRFLKTVRDLEVVYYWQKEFPLLAGKPQAPVLTRLDTFLRPKPLRYMVGQRENRLDFAAIMNGGKIFLAKLAQGLVGEENASLLGSLLVSKFHQLAMSRQQLRQAERRPFYLYIDEFQHFVTPSMAAILEGARKYRLGLVLAHQDLHQLAGREADVLNAVLANAYTRICFRVSGPDAKKLEDGFSYFNASDLQNLGVGEAICRIERADYDFNLQTVPAPPREREQTGDRRDRLIALSRERYGTPRHAVEAALARATPAPEPQSEAAGEAPLPAEQARLRPRPAPRVARTPAAAVGSALPEAPTREGPIPVEVSLPAGRGGRQHKYLQELIKRWAESKGWRAVLEERVLDDLGSVDVALEKDDRRVACEISVTTPTDHEVGNAQKCLAAGFDQVVMVSADRKTLRQVSVALDAALGKEERSRVRCLTPEETFAFLEELDAVAASREETVRGYKVKVQYKPLAEGERETRRQAISSVIVRALRRLKTPKD